VEASKRNEELQVEDIFAQAYSLDSFAELPSKFLWQKTGSK